MKPKPFDVEGFCKYVMDMERKKYGDALDEWLPKQKPKRKRKKRSKNDN